MPKKLLHYENVILSQKHKEAVSNGMAVIRDLPQKHML